MILLAFELRAFYPGDTTESSLPPTSPMIIIAEKFLLLLVGGDFLYGAHYGVKGGGNFVGIILYLGFLLYVGACLKTGETELYVLTVSKDEKPILYWSMMGILAIAAVIMGFYLSKNL